MSVASQNEMTPQPSSKPGGLIAVAMSGGVDSSAVAALLLRQGREVVGLTMQLWNQRRLPELMGETPAHGRCCSLDDVYDAKRVAQHLGFSHYVVNFEAQFEERVVRPFVAEYLAGRTPIACANCNTGVKFEPLLLMARQAGVERLATGHYARVRHNPATNRFELLRARDESKDQTYFLFGLTQEQLARTDFPLGDLTKEEARELARSAGLAVADKPESMELCFVPNGNYAQFIEAYQRDQGAPLPAAGGEIARQNGEVLARHAGLHQFTVGQRKGLGVSTGEPLYVISIDPAANRVTVGEDAALRQTVCEVERVNWIACAAPQTPVRAEVKIRHKHEAAAATVEALDATCARVTFDAPQRAITPGQAAVFYSGEVVLGGGWIAREK
jgi:tRNA-specific 2-thiouridylase